MKVRAMSTVLFLGVAVAALAQEAGGKHVAVATVAPRRADVATIDGMVKTYYEVISGPAGTPRDWARDRTLYIPDLRFVAVDVDKQGQKAPIIMRRINSIELFWDGKRWWIANAIWTDETKETPIPKEYLPG